MRVILNPDLITWHVHAHCFWLRMRRARHAKGCTRAGNARAHARTPPQGAVAGDINGDGKLEVVLGTADGSVHVLKGHDGSYAPNFPFRTRGK